VSQEEFDMAQQEDILHVKQRKRRVGKVGGYIVTGEACCPPSLHPSLTAEEAGTIAAQLRALADPTRVQIVMMLAEHPGEVCVCDITSNFDLDQSTISHHLRLLREAGIIDSVRHGVWAYYFLRPGVLAPILQLLKRLEASNQQSS
jgi:ArsR family transcriptional regulator